ncbi:MAG: metallophosphoesterase [Gemmataceae bacterium]
MDFARIALTFVAWPGHAFSLTVALNLIYSFALPRKLQRGGRLAVGILVFLFPLIALFDFTGPGALAFLVRWYLYFTCVVSLVFLPAMTIRRWLRKPPKELIESKSHVVNIAKDLGAAPLGFGKHWRLARFPGNQILEVEFTERTLRLPRLPLAWNGLTILHLTDLHFHGTPGKPFFTRVFDLLMEAEPPDLICITGDYVDSVRHHAWIKAMLGKLKWREGAFAILGNHDFWSAPQSVRRQVRRAHFVTPGNGWHLATIRGEPLVVIGHEGPWFRPAPDLSDCPRGSFRLCLSHTPDNIAWAARNHVDLMFAGHVHGGQVRVPILGPLFVPSRHSRKYDGGCYKLCSTVMYVSRGLSGREPLRWNCRPEVTRIRLVV